MRKYIYLLLIPTLLSCSNQDRKIPESFDFGKTEKGAYTNDYFKMKVSFDPDWVVQDKQQMNQLVEMGGEMVSGDNEELKSLIKSSQVNTAYLLAVFKHEVGAPVDYNPNFMLIAENTKNFPGIQDGSDYLFHVKKLLDQTEMQYSFEKDVYPKKIGKVTFHVLENKLDFMGTSIYQDYFATIRKGFSLSFVLSYANESQKEELYEIVDNINFLGAEE